MFFINLNRFLKNYWQAVSFVYSTNIVSDIIAIFNGQIILDNALDSGDEICTTTQAVA